MSRARSVEIYLKPGIEEDDQVHEIWMALRGRARPQDVFRRALRLGIRVMAEGGELPRAALEALDPDLLGSPGPARALLARGRKARIRQQQEAAAPREPAAPAPRAEPRPPVQPLRETAPTVDPATPAEPQKRKLGRIM